MWKTTGHAIAFWAHVLLSVVITLSFTLPSRLWALILPSSTLIYKTNSFLRRRVEPSKKEDEKQKIAKLLVYMVVTLKPRTRRAGVYTISIRKIWLA